MPLVTDSEVALPHDCLILALQIKALLRLRRLDEAVREAKAAFRASQDSQELLDVCTPLAANAALLSTFSLHFVCVCPNESRHSSTPSLLVVAQCRCAASH